MMTSFIKLGLFEREARSPALNVKQLALLLCGEDPELKTAEIPENKVKEYKIYYRHISKWIDASGVFNGGNATPFPSDYMFALAFLMIDPDMTPKPIQERCLESVEIIANKNNGKEILRKLGGEELYKVGLELSKNKRGLHRKDDEADNNSKMIAYLIKLLAYKVGHSYGSASKPVRSTIYNDIIALSKQENLPLIGMSRSTFYEKVKQSLLDLESSE